ncbi:winged helix-turn-helix transcriptional regulator [Streptomyces sp. NPDC015345]|uniref:winged helix-turn-helix transcriptional regulator n=1 Tax=Streptomyces sp. NPDC015345 TaxID=3364953 RepID=UPI00370145D7
MAVRKEREPYACGLDAAVDVVGGKWKPMILWALYAGRTLRFGELRRHIPGVSEKMLIQQLRELESDGIVHREVYREVPPKVEYSLTDLGQSLNTALLPLGLWGDQHMEQIVAGKANGSADGSNGTNNGANNGTGKGSGTGTDETDTANKAQNAA